MGSKLLMVALLAVALVGCSSNQSMKNALKTSRSLYGEYLNPPVVVSYDIPEMEEADTLLAKRMVGIDTQIQRLERLLANADKPPTPDWVGYVFRRLPWVSGVAAVDANGNIVGQEPAIPLKDLDYTPMLEADPKQNARDLRGYVQDTAMGPESYLAIPVFQGVDMMGLVCIHFDFRALLPYSAEPENLIVLTEDIVVWPGKFDYTQTPLQEVDWKSEIPNRSRGIVSNDKGSFYWVSRYLGNQALIFATPIDGEFPEIPSQLEGMGRVPATPIAPLTRESSILDDKLDSILLDPAPSSLKTPVLEQNIE